ncbi:CRISPR-associated endonuclease Cas2 [Marinimicrobium sp. ARAG 43.8]|uniref:CRISPR-associated endonuclease Cas2 n=1 Tax=Marinimicrobium sp. ARAG 43.8 TaxID=3418719 RepID=UPI003CF1FF00
MAHYLVCYDIANPRRLGRVHRRVIKHALFIQFSVYYLQGTRQSVEALMDDLREVIDEGHDDIRIYAIKPLSGALHKGCSWLPEGIELFE